MKRRGRQPKPEHLRRKRRLHVVLRDQEWAMLEARALESGLLISDYVRIKLGLQQAA